MTLYNDLRSIADSLDTLKQSLLDFEKEERALAFNQERARIRKFEQARLEREERLRA